MRAWATTQDDLQIYFEDTGDTEKPILVFQSGFMGIHDIWIHQVTALSGRFRCITHDNRGYGASSSPADPGFYTAKNNAEDLAAVLNATGVTDPFLLVTHSMGSYIALEFTQRHPGRVRGMIMMGGAAGPRRAQDDESASDVDVFARHHTSPEASMQFYADFGLEKPIALEAAKWRRHVFRNQTRPAQDYQALRPLDEITIPVQVLHGTADVISPAEVPKALVHLLPNAELRMIDGANHFPQTEQPEVINAIIDDFHAATLRA